MPIYFAAKEYTENLFYFENASSPEKYSIFKGSIFDGRNREMDIKKKWENGSRDKEKIGHSFFKTSPDIISNNELLLSDYIHKDKTNIFFFPSSIHETFSLGELYHHPHFSGQTECIKWLSNYFTSRDRFNFVVREHPILANKTIKEREEWRCLFKDYKIKFIPFDCELSTYEILKKIDAVVVYHSTVAIEAAYRNIPSMALGSPWYIGLGSVFAPKNLHEIDSFFNNPNRYISDSGLTKSLMYGYYIKTYGTPYRYTKFIKKFISY